MESLFLPAGVAVVLSAIFCRILLVVVGVGRLAGCLLYRSGRFSQGLLHDVSIRLVEKSVQMLCSQVMELAKAI